MTRKKILALFLFGNLALLSVQSSGQESEQKKISSKEIFTRVNEIKFSSGPHVQSVGPISANVLFEGRFRNNPTVTFFRDGDTQKFQVEAKKVDRSIFRNGKSYLYQAELQGLASSSRYLYQISTDKEKSILFSFKTQHLNAHSFAFLAMSNGEKEEKITKKVVEDSVLKHAVANYKQESLFPMSMAFFAGDLVSNGNDLSSWRKEYFAPLAPLISRLSVFPAFGQNEGNANTVGEFFRVPTSLMPELSGRVYSFDYQNVRFITLDSVKSSLFASELTWLSDNLSELRENPQIEFLIVQIHHSPYAEILPDAESAFSKEVAHKLAAFAINWNKHIVLMAGNIHGYSRGHHDLAPLTYINVGSLGAKLEKWSSKKTRDYRDILKSQDEYGWLLFQANNSRQELVSNRSQPLTKQSYLHLKRYSYGDKKNLEDRGIKDEILLKEGNLPPTAPALQRQQEANGDWYYTSSEFQDLDSELPDQHLSTLFELISMEEGRTKVEWSTLVHAYNEFNGKVQDNANLLLKLKESAIPKEILKKAQEQKNFFLRVRYRDSSLSWGQWSNLVPLVQ